MKCQYWQTDGYYKMLESVREVIYDWDGVSINEDYLGGVFDPPREPGVYEISGTGSLYIKTDDGVNWIYTYGDEYGTDEMWEGFDDD